MANRIADTLTRLNIVLKSTPAPLAAYVPFVRTGNLVFISGHIAKKDGAVNAAKLGTAAECEKGKFMTTADGVLAARSVAVDLLGTLQTAAGVRHGFCCVIAVTMLCLFTQS